MPLTDTKIKSLKPAEKIHKVSDGGGLHIRVETNGSRRWVLSYRFDGRQKDLALGVYPEVSLADAREAREAAKKLLKKGVDPNQRKKIEKLSGQERRANTLAVLAEEFLQQNVRDGLAESTIRKKRGYLSFALPTLGDQPIDEIKASDILAVMKAVEATGHLETARRVRAVMGEVIRYAIKTTRAESDPTAALRGATASPKKKPMPAITNPKRFGELLRAIDELSSVHWQTRAGLQLLALLAVRPGELRGATWAEIDFDKAVWTIPAARTKMRREHQMPLARQTIAILKQCRTLSGGKGYVLPGVISVKKTLSENTLNQGLRRCGFLADEATSHGFRASFSTLANESGKWSIDAIERHLAHQDKDAVRRAYARGAYWQEREELCQWWADQCDALRKVTGNI